MSQQVIVKWWLRALFTFILSLSLSIMVLLTTCIISILFPQIILPLPFFVIFSFVLIICAITSFVYSKYLRRSLEGETLLIQKAKTGLQLVKTGIALISISALPLAYILLRPFLHTFPPLPSLSLLYFIYESFPLDIYVSYVIFVACFSFACLLSIIGLFLRRKN